MDLQSPSASAIATATARECPSDHILAVCLEMKSNDEGEEDISFEAVTIGGEHLGVVRRPVSRPVHYLVSDVLDLLGSSLRELRRARDGALYSFEEFCNWYGDVSLASARWPEARDIQVPSGIRELRRARDGAFYSFEEFFDWYGTVSLASQRWYAARDILPPNARVVLLWENTFEIGRSLLRSPLCHLSWWHRPDGDQRYIDEKERKKFKAYSLWAFLAGSVATCLSQVLKHRALIKARSNRCRGLAPLLGFAVRYDGPSRQLSGFALSPGDIGEIVSCGRETSGYLCLFPGACKGEVFVKPEHLVGSLEGVDINPDDFILYVGPRRHVFATVANRPHDRSIVRKPQILEHGAKGAAVSRVSSESSGGGASSRVGARFPRIGTVTLKNCEVGWSSLNFLSDHLCLSEQ